MLPDFTIYNVKNKAVTKDSFLAPGKVIVLNFWASWCNPCKTEMLEIKRIKAEKEFNDVQFISVSIDKETDTPNAKKWFKDKKCNWPLYFDPKSELLNKILTLTENTSTAIPITLVITKEGEIFSLHQSFDIETYRTELLEDINSIK